MQPLSGPEVAKLIQPTEQAPTYAATKGLVVDPSAMWPIHLFGGKPRSWFVSNGTIYADDTIVLDTPETKPLSNP